MLSIEVRNDALVFRRRLDLVERKGATGAYPIC